MNIDNVATTAIANVTSIELEVVAVAVVVVVGLGRSRSRSRSHCRRLLVRRRFVGAPSLMRCALRLLMHVPFGRIPLRFVFSANTACIALL